jgi:hypothetical protein
LCHLIGVTQLPDPHIAGEYEVCSSTVCVIDDVNINLVDTTGNRTVVSQICPNCTPTNPCTCIISGVNLNDTMEASGIGPIYQQICGPANAQCFNTATGTAQAQPCPPASQFINADANVQFPIAFVIILFLLLVIIIVVMLMTRHTKTEVLTPEDYAHPPVESNPPPPTKEAWPYSTEVQ